MTQNDTTTHRTDHAVSTGRGSSPLSVPCADVDAAWAALIDRDVADDEIRHACRILIDTCTDGRRDTARDMLAVLG